MQLSSQVEVVSCEDGAIAGVAVGATQSASGGRIIASLHIEIQNIMTQNIITEKITF